MNTSEYVYESVFTGLVVSKRFRAIQRFQKAMWPSIQSNLNTQHMPDSDVIDTGAAISDAVREAAARMRPATTHTE